MKRKLLSLAILMSAVLLSGPGTSGSAETLSGQRGLKIRTIYLDPSYGGRARGPSFGGRQYGKDVTLKIAQKLQGLLEADGFAVRLSRTGDQFVSLDDRSSQAKSKSADIHVIISVSHREENCVRIVILRPELKASQPKPNERKTAKRKDLKTELDRIFKSLEIDSRQEESLHLASMISKKLKDDRATDCVSLLKGFYYVLIHAEMPAVTVDFGVSRTSKKQPYILEETAVDKITRSLAGSIKEFSDARVKRATQ